MATSTMSPTLGDIVYWEEDNNYSRDVVTVALGQNLSLGTVVGKITATGEYTILAPAAVDGSEVAAGIMLADCDATAAATDGVALVREAIISSEELVWPDGILDSEKATALEQLKTLGIITRTTT